MNRVTFGFVVAILVSAATVTLADRAVAQAAPTAVAAANPKLAGTWEGTYTTDGPSGGMTATFKAGTPWAVTNALTGDAPAGSDTRDVALDGDKIVWKQTFGEYEVTFTGTLSADGAKVTGTLEASQGGSVVAGGNFSLDRKA
jgi:hypothetical protein